MLPRLNAFIKVARKGSFTKAAKELYISQPALSKQMKRLEEELGFALFDRTSSGVELTEKGAGLYKELSPLFERIHHTVKHFQSSEEIRFGSTPMITTYFLHEHYERLQHANFRVTEVKDDSQELSPLLEKRQIDAAIIQDIPTYKTVPSSHLFTDEFYAAIPIQSPFSLKKEVTIEECFTYPQIIPSQGALSDKIRAVMNERNFAGEVVTAQYHAMAGLVSLGVGIAYLPHVMVRQIEFRGVAFLPIQDSPFKREMYLCARNENLLAYVKGLLTGDN
ncbi:LysR family transcriptional regulator [Rossellomorea aquimaris]|uniref:LysR family transcriptional regulator n=1 Tax=Rossellomorea aquimaris TaxID=189382 RepID=UPI001CD1EBFB|nr:LysR family transcriptional regulator [Rossellomorea aquimaris]MCA1055850.1 LysR family transcriptional regulator [Rossellomorea aquimaris]